MVTVLHDRVLYGPAVNALLQSTNARHIDRIIFVIFVSFLTLYVV